MSHVVGILHDHHRSILKQLNWSCCIAECCNVLQSVAVCCRVLQCVAECHSVLQSATVCCIVFLFKRLSWKGNEPWPFRVLFLTLITMSILIFSWTGCNILKQTVTLWNTLQHSATHRNTLQHTATLCNTLLHTATHCNTLQHTATRCNTLFSERAQVSNPVFFSHALHVLQCVAICCNVLHCVALCRSVCCSVLRHVTLTRERAQSQQSSLFSCPT